MSMIMNNTIWNIMDIIMDKYYGYMDNNLYLS